MAVVGNKVTEIGDVILVETEIPITGVSEITGFVDSVGGEVVDRFFTKEFRYSLDGGLNYNLEGYIPLSNANLQAIPVNPTFDLKFEYRYVRSGTNASGDLIWNFTQLEVVFDERDCGEAFRNSIFSFFFSTCHEPEIIRWAINVLEKIYKPGIIPKFITRNENQNINDEDRDYIDFWRSLTTYFAMIVAYARRFETFYTDKRLVIEFLSQRGVYVCEDQSLQDLRYIQNNYYDEIRHRGTFMIVKKKGDLIGGNSKPVDGELLRLICFRRSCDEFQFIKSEFDTIGWVVNRWSPLWQGISHQKQAYKLYEQSENILDLSNYPLINDQYITKVDEIGGETTMTIDQVPVGEISGIGIVGGVYDEQYATNIDPNLPYEIGFFVKTDAGSGEVPPITLKLFSYTQDGTPISNQEIKTGGFLDTNTVFEKVQMPEGEYYYITATILPISHIYTGAQHITTPNHLQGNNLKFKSENCCKLIPQLIVDNTSGSFTTSPIKFYNFKVSIARTDYGTGFIAASNFIQTWMNNNQKTFSNEKVTNIMQRFLLPYNTSLYNNYL